MKATSYLLVCALACTLILDSFGLSGQSAAVAATAFTCTEVIGFSETQQWYEGSGSPGAGGSNGFIQNVSNPGNWQLRWYSGGSVDLWANPNFDGWNPQYLVTQCASGASNPDRVVMNVSGNYNSDPNWWAQQTRSVVQNIRAKYPNERAIGLQSVIGGPGGSQCIDPSTGHIVRASYNYPYINQGFLQDTGGEVFVADSDQVGACSDYQDDIGHLTSPGSQAVGASEAHWWNTNDAQPATPTPISATNTPTQTSVPATKTPTPVPTAGTAQTQTITFDDLSDPNRPLNGQYPSGLVDWGNGVWYLSGPYGSFTGNSVSFNGSSPTTATFSFVSAHRLIQLDAYNGGSSASTVTLTCDGGTSTQAVLAGGQTATLPTGWVGPCGTVTIASSNGWYTNFKNLVVDGGSGVAPTSTPSATPTQVQAPTSTPTAVPANTSTPTPRPTTRPSDTPTPTATPSARPTNTPTPTPTASGSPTRQTVTFDDLSSPGRPLNGQYPSGTIDWGTGQWWLSGPVGKFTTNSVSFNGPALAAATFTFVSPHRLVQLDIYNGGPTTTTVSLACAGQLTRQVQVAAGQVATVTTGWTGLCTSVTISSTNGWSTNFDNLVIDALAALS